jgi:DNA double-strand break repair helicase HerA and related ATPase
METKLLEACRSAFESTGPALTLGAPMYDTECAPEPLVRLSIAMTNRHGLIAGATGTGKTKTLQLVAEQLSAAGVPVFLADLKGDLSGLGAAGEANDKVEQRARDTGWTWSPSPYPVEFLSLFGARGAQLRATVSSFGPLLFAKVLDLNDTQAGVLALAFKFCDDRNLELYDFGDLRAVLDHLTGAGAGELKGYGGISKPTVGVLQRKLVTLEGQGATAFFGEPEFDLGDLMQMERDGRGLVSVLELSDVQDKPALFSTFLMWMLARLYNELPEVGDQDKPKLVFFFDEAHLLFDGASKAFLEQVEKVVRLIRSKGVGIFFVTQTPKDVPPDVLAQLGHRVQHALRAFTPNDEKALRATAKTFPRSDFYDLEEVLTTLGIGEAMVTVLSPKGVPSQPFATRLIPPASRMAPLTDAQLQQRIAVSPQVKKYSPAIDRESAEEKLAAPAATDAPAAAPPTAPAGRPEPSTLEKVLRSPVARAVATTVSGALARSILGVLVGPPRRRQRW